MTDFYSTLAGRKFYESDLPRLIEALEKIAKELEKANDKRTERKTD